jgi:hypothetical protein
MRIPAHLQQVSEQLALRAWVARSDFPSDTHFESIDIFKERVQKHQPDEADPEAPDRLIAIMIGAALDAEGALLTEVLSVATFEISDEDEWARCCEAAGWVVLQAYENACSKGEWPRG